MSSIAKCSLYIPLRYHDSRPQKGMEGGSPTIEIWYHCAQDKKSQRKSGKHANVAKHQDHQYMTYFDCQSHLNIMLQVISGVLMAKIDLKHADDHIPYCTTAIPPKDLQWILTNKTRSMKEVSTHTSIIQMRGELTTSLRFGKESPAATNHRVPHSHILQHISIGAH